MISRADLVRQEFYGDSNLKSTNGWVVYGISYLVGLLSLLPRFEEFRYQFGKYLWAEDGTVFLIQAQSLGLAAFLKPYAGYLHFYPRLVAALSQFFDFLYQPTILLVGWFFAYFVLVHALVWSALLVRGGLAVILPLIALVSLQSSYGEVFFNITNSQWMLGAALFLYVLCDSASGSANQVRKAMYIFPLTITGPFSVILVPVMALKVLVERNWHRDKAVYLVVLLGASVQVVSLFMSNRVSSGGLNKDPWEWIVTFIKLAFFGAETVWSILAALALWCLMGYLIFQKWRSSRCADAVLLASLLLLISAFLLIVAGLVSSKHNPQSIVALGGGNRYTWIPYTLIVVASILLSASRKRLYAVVVVLYAFLFRDNFHSVGSANLQFESFAKFSQADGVIIPINPQWAKFPGWSISKDKQPSAEAVVRTEVELVPGHITASGMGAEVTGDGLKITSEGNDPVVSVNDKVVCPGRFHVGMNVYMTRGKEGWMQVFWNEKRMHNPLESLRRWYPSGEIKAQFAFPISPEGTYVRFDPMEQIDSGVIRKIEIFCL